MIPKLLLASNSPRRRQLLADAGFDFDSIAPRGKERFDSHFSLRELTAWNALRKGLSVAHAHPNDVVLSADTLVAIDHQLLGKPQSAAGAFKMLSKLNGRVHEVCSAVFICHWRAVKSVFFCEISRVRFRSLTDARIRDYLRKIKPLDKAGGYAAQESGSEIIEEIKGSYTNVVGLPMEQTIAALAEFGVTPRKAIRRNP